MALRRDPARNLRRALAREASFMAAVAAEIAAGRLKRKVGEKLILDYYNARPRLEYQLAWALRDQHDL